MNIIFLDVDGVLCTMRSHLGHGKFGGMMEDWCPMSCGMLKTICKKYDFRIVMSSSWRIIDPQLMETRLKQHDLFQFYDYDKEWRQTPHSVTGRFETTDRWEEIQAWMDAFSAYLNVEKFIIIDDEDCSGYRDHWIATEFQEGFSVTHFEKINKLLRDGII